ncbi:hypothetical protein BGX30_007048 [Mortierella sp. GBA39]|nr:hypothetical protein BGX30_007048 [Mortierella sp. GBA39]
MPSKALSRTSMPTGPTKRILTQTPVLSSSSCPPPAAPSPYRLPYRLPYKDLKDNKYDLSVAEDAEEALAAAEEDGSAIRKMAGAEYAALDLDSKVSMSVYLDKDDKVSE